MLPRSIATSVAVGGLVLAAVPAAPAGASETRRASWHGKSWSVPINLSGQTSANAAVRASSACAIGRCTAETRADGRGRWRVRFDAVVKPGTTSLTVRLRSGGRTLTRPFALVAPRAAPPGAGAVMLIGDSLTVGMAGLLPGVLPDHAITAQAANGRRLGAGLSLFSHTPLDPRIGVVVFGLFTNDDPRAVASLQRGVTSTLERLGGRRCAVWYTVRRPAVDGVGYRRANDRLHAIAADPSSAGRLVVVPWAEAIAANPALLGRDRVHPTPEGYRLRAQLTADAIRRCPVTAS